jgi:hypothetical protein
MCFVFKNNGRRNTESTVPEFSRILLKFVFREEVKKTGNTESVEPTEKPPAAPVANTESQLKEVILKKKEGKRLPEKRRWVAGGRKKRERLFRNL